MNNNTMKKTDFCLEHIIWGVLAFLWYRVIFRCVGECSLVFSRLILFGCILLVSVLFGVVEFRRARNGFSVFINLATGYGLYTMFAYMQFKSRLMQISLITATIFSVICMTYIMTRRIRNGKNVTKVIFRRINKALLVTRTMFGLSMVAIVLLIGVDGTFGNSILYSSSVVYTDSDVDKQTLANNIETVALLEETRWKELSAQEKIDVLQVVANIERRYLGSPHELNVGAANLKEGTLGNYNDASHQITVDLDHLVYDTPESILDTVLHEAWHAYEHRCWDAYRDADDKSKALKMFRRVAKYGDEFADYVDGDKDSYGYYMQACEEDAREYAESAVEDYFEKINAFYGEEVIGNWDGGWDSYQVSYSVVYEDDGYAYLKNKNGEKIAGPYLYIEEDLGWIWDKTCRYTGMNGLIGYLDIEGNEITEPIFIEASKMNDGKALVSEKTGCVYYINTDGERITEDFMDGFPYEHQGCFARVLQADGWAIVNRDGEIVFSGADFINELPLVTVTGSAVKNGNAVIFCLDAGSDEEFRIVKMLDQYKDISYVHCATFAVVKNEDDLYGVVDYNGDTVIESQYSSVEYEIIDDEDDSWYGDHVRFKLQNQEGTYVIKEIKL